MTMKPSSILHYKNGTRLELWVGEADGAHKTVYVDEKGWQTDNWWSTEDMARASFEGSLERARDEGVLERVE
jgi:hypothetical protein